MTGFARRGMRQELSRLWQSCFGDPAEYPDFFLSRLVSPQDCLVTTVDGKLASAVYLLPAHIRTGGKSVPAHYIFAAATAPEFRSRGIMSALLRRAAEEGERRGDAYSAVLPADQGLYRFYAAAGYEDFFEVQKTELSASALRDLAGSAGPSSADRPDDGWAGRNRRRAEMLAGNSGSLLWDDRMFRGAVSMNLVYGDRFVCPDASSYALCRRERDRCTVLEAVAARGAFSALAAAVFREIPAERYCFRLPVGCKFFPGNGKTERFGMLKGLGGRTVKDAKPFHPYLGLGMD